MITSLRAMALVGFALLLAASQSHAQAPPNQASGPGVLTDIRSAVVRLIGAQDKEVEIKMAGKVLVVMRVNSNMNAGTHAGRDNEAQAIVAAVAKGLAEKPELGSLVAVRVEYVTRSRWRSRVVDRVEFRRDPSGRFQFHQT